MEDKCAREVADVPVENLTREQRRSRRKREIRARTISIKRMSACELELGRQLYPDDGHWRPRTRADCANGLRPCPYVSCEYHLYLDVSDKTGSIKLNFPDLEVWEMNETCALDVAERGGTTLEEVGAIMNMTRERIRQLEARAKSAMKPGLPPELDPGFDEEEAHLWVSESEARVLEEQERETDMGSLTRKQVA